MSPSRTLSLVAGAPLVLLLAIQLVPYGRSRTNPPPGELVVWDSPRTEELARRACFDCHSNETRWPWYSAIAPASWRIQSHVMEGRERLNFTAFDPAHPKMAEEASEATEAVTQGKMPPRDYQLMHPEARLSADEKRTLASSLEAMFAGFGEKHGRAGHGEESDRSHGAGEEARAEAGEGHER